MQSPSASSENHIYFNGGHLVKHKLPNSPLMCVVGPQKLRNATEGTSKFNGIVCQWFTTDGKLQESVFNTKDLRHASQSESLGTPSKN